MKVRTLMSYYGYNNSISFSDGTFQTIIKPS